VQLRKTRSGGGSSLIGSAELVEIKARNQSMAGIAAYASADMTLTGGVGHAERVACGQVTADFLPLLGVQPALGRNFTREEDAPNGPRVVILGHGIWQSRFGGDPRVLGRAITLSKERYVVVGILPAHFQFHEAFQLWTPLALGDAGAGETMRLLKVIARLKSAVTVEQAQAELETMAGRQAVRPGGAGPARAPLAQGPAGLAASPLPPPSAPGGEEGALTLIGLHEQVVGDVKGALLVLLGAVAFVLLIACANVANLIGDRQWDAMSGMATRAAAIPVRCSGVARSCRITLAHSTVIAG
jgi:hypothetical protein